MKFPKIHIGYIRPLWRCPSCGDTFETPNSPHSCPERRHHKHRMKAMRQGVGIGFAAGLFVFMFVLLLIQRGLISTYADTFAFTRAAMENIQQVNKVILTSRFVWGDKPLPRKFEEKD